MRCCDDSIRKDIGSTLSYCIKSLNPCQNNKAGDSMAVHELAGTKVRPEDYIDLDAMTKAYHSIHPDAADPHQQVRFGTSGHRGQAAAAVLRQTTSRPLPRPFVTSVTTLVPTDRCSSGPTPIIYRNWLSKRYCLSFRPIRLRPMSMPTAILSRRRLFQGLSCALMTTARKT